MQFQKVRLLDKKMSGTTTLYEYYGVVFPSYIGAKWSGATVQITDQGSVLTIQKVEILKRRKTLGQIPIT